MLLSKIGFILNNIGIGWYCRQRWFQFTRLMTNTSVLPSIILGVLAIYISIMLFLLTQKNPSIDALNSILIILLIITFLAVAGGRLFFTSQTPEIYADYSVQGRSYSDAIIYISYCIWKECKFVEKNKKIFKKFEALFRHSGDSNKCDLSKADLKSIMKLQLKMNQRQHKIQRIDYMIVGLGKAMNVPANRLSDYLFQFSPEIYDLEFRRAMKRMKEIINILDYPDSDKRKLQQSEKIRNLYDIVTKRIGYQASIIKNRDLHDTIIGMSSGFGLTNALESYCLGLQMVSNTENVRDKQISFVMDRLKFLYHKRRMFPGFDLHSILVNYARQNKSDQLLHGLLVLANEKNKPLFDNYKEVTEPLSNLVNKINNYIYTQRQQITKKVKDLLKEDLKNPNNSNKKKIVAITQGFSTAVNDALYEVMKYADKNNSEVDKEFLNLIRGKDIY